MKQEISLIAVAALFILAAGMIETRPEMSLLLIAGMAVPAAFGKLGKRRVSCEDIERRCRNAKN